MHILPLLTLLVHSAMSDQDMRVITSLKYSSYRVKPTVVNGEPVGSDRVPYLVSIKEPNGQLTADEILWSNLCGGSIIGEQKVLTAAHCFEGNDYFYANHPHVLRIFAGSNNTFIGHSGETETSNDIQVRKIDRIILNSNFHFPTNDIALVFVDVAWNFTDSVDYIIPAKKTLDYPTVCITAGFGKVNHDARAPDSEVLLIGRIKVLTRWKCSTLWGMNMNTFVCTDSQIADVARGDSGGPLACFDTDDPEELPDKELLVGVVSGKNFDKTTIYTRVSEYHDWIENNSGFRMTSTLFTVFTIISILSIYLLFF